MLNQVVLVGRLTSDPEVLHTDSGHRKSNINLAVARSYKNSNGEYETDFISCKLWDAIASNVAQYCSKGDLLGIKGRIESRVYEKDGSKKYIVEIIAEKVTFLSSKKADE